MPINHFKIIIPTNLTPPPDKYEEAVARILAHKFQSDILFVARGTNHTPDIFVAKTKEYWEIKNIRGNSKFTIEDNLRKAAKQADNIVISLLRSKMTPEHASARIRHYLSHAHRNIKHVVLITRRSKTLDFYA